MPRWVLAPLLLSLVPLACKDGQPPLVVRDSEGRAFETSCDRDKQGNCTLTQRSGPRWPGNLPAVVLLRTNRLIGVCNVTEGQGVESTIDCRPLVCQKDT